MRGGVRRSRWHRLPALLIASGLLVVVVLSRDETRLDQPLDESRVLLSHRECLIDLDSSSGGEHGFVPFGVVPFLQVGLPVQAGPPALPERYVVEVHSGLKEHLVLVRRALAL